MQSLRRERPDRIVNEPALLFLLALNVLQITILYFDAVALTEGTPSSAFVSGLILVLGASAGAFFFMILLRSHGLRRDKCRNGDKGCEGENSQRSHNGHLLLAPPQHDPRRRIYSSASDLFV